ncbi:hypothetical protein [Streptomyces sp. CBMA29]|uniref:hypothetical protein n=1 Tax=Streptomyces sp. CBMA29 TaxID=1896314 RepID=UPI001661EC75|nr:hypothetical protein [Streptomyces sp. CBMA29]MBD0734258.1 hypothetical protein [Streptomyces sp. CBMA29]
MRSAISKRRSLVRGDRRFRALSPLLPHGCATGCGPLDRPVDNRLGLPAATGDAMRLSAYHTFRAYDQLPPR